MEAQRWDEYYRDPNHPTLPYSAWRGPNGEIIHPDDDLAPDPLVMACFWFVVLLFLLAIIIVPFYL